MDSNDESESDFDDLLLDSDYDPFDQSSLQLSANDSDADESDNIILAENTTNTENIEAVQNESQWTEYVGRHQFFEFNGIVDYSFFFLLRDFAIFLISFKFQA